MLREAKMQLRKVQLELDVRQATLEIVKKDPGADPDRLANAEKAAMVTALRTKYKLCELLPVVGMAKSSYEYARNVQLKGETEEHAAAREAVIAAFESSGGTYGYRRIVAEVNAGSGSESRVGEWTVRAIMAEGEPGRMRRQEEAALQLLRGRDVRSASEPAARRAGKAPLPRRQPERDMDNGRHRVPHPRRQGLSLANRRLFRRDAAELVDLHVSRCRDGELLAGSERVSGSTRATTRPVHSDRGGHYRWPGWIKICEENGLVRSMSRKGCSPDNARCEGFFGRLKVEFFYGRDWDGVTIEEFITMLDAYLRWYRDIRIKSDLDYKSPMQYRRDLGLVA